MVHSTALSKSSSVSTASANMMSGDFPPSSRVVGFRFCTAARPIRLPVATLPVKETFATSGLALHVPQSILASKHLSKRHRQHTGTKLPLMTIRRTEIG